jgi:hypothetical protein
MPINKESEIVSNKEAEKENKRTENQRAKIQAEADKAQDEKAKELDKKFGGDGTASDRQKTEKRMKDILEMLRKAVEKQGDAKSDLDDFSLAIQEKRADLPDKKKLTVEEFNAWRNDLNEIIAERDRNAQSGQDTLRYIVDKIAADAE